MFLNALSHTENEKQFFHSMENLRGILRRHTQVPVTPQRVSRNCDVLEAFAEQIRNHEDTIARLMVDSTHRPFGSCLTEARRCLQTLEKTRDSALALCKPTAYDFSDALQGGHTAIAQRFTYAPLFAITPFNFPLNLTLHKIAPALALGLPFVCKPALQSVELFAHINEWLTIAGADDNSFAFYFASNEHVTRALEELPAPLVSFTGSRKVGLALKKKFWDRRMILELGSTALAILCCDVPRWELEHLSQELARSAFGNAGQSCISLQHLLLENDVFEDTVSHVKHTALNIIQNQDPASSQSIVGPLINQQAFAKAMNLVQQAQDQGAQVWSAGPHAPEKNYFAPTLVFFPPGQSKKTLESIELAREEVFAPIVCIHQLANNTPIDKLNDVVRRLDSNIHTAVFTYDNKRARQFYEVLPSRTVLWNEIPSWRADAMPYGGLDLRWRDGHLQSGGLLGDEGPYQTLLELTVERLFVLP